MCAKVIIDRKTNLLTGLMLLLAVLFSACSEHDVETEVPVDPVVDEDDGPIELAFACIPSSHAGTRLDGAIVQNAAPYRDIVGFRVISFYKDGGNILTVSNSMIEFPQLPADKTTTRYYHFGYCEMTKGTNGSFVYAKAKDGSKEGVHASVYNGRLDSDIPKYNIYSTNQISFEPVSILEDVTTGAGAIHVDSDGIPDDAWILANVLTDIASIEGWNTRNENKLKPLLEHFTNYGYDLPGSAASVRKWIEAVKIAADGFGNLGSGTVEEIIRQEIISKADEYLGLTDPENTMKSIRMMTYPQSINLPDGAAVVRWTEVEEEVGGEVKKVKKFVPQLKSTTLDDINTVTDFVYPPELYYFVESDIWTSNSAVSFDQYKNRSTWKGNDDTWNGADDGTVQWLFKDGGTVSKSTKTVAIADPLQYAVARLNLTVSVHEQADDIKLKYNGDNTIAYTDGTNNYFRLTGVIVGGQRKVGYDFKPIDNSDAGVRFAYDSQVADGFYLQKNSNGEFNTLVLQSWDNEDVKVILEFEYTGSTEFKCLNGYVYPNTRFYLVGEVKAADFVAGTDDETNRGRVFTQDYTTTIEMTVQSLEKAYNVLPSLLSKNLEIGVMTTPKWKAATPQEAIIME